MINYKLTIAYEGTRYRGWQAQGNTDMTVQGKLQAALSKMCGYVVEINGSGRTDAGVHARGQTANFKLKEHRGPNEILEYLNAYLPEDIAALSVEEVPERFHARLSATRKTYRYRIWTAAVRDVFARRYVTEVRETLNVRAMQEAASYLIGTHDFTSFCGNRRFKKSGVRTIYKIELTETEKELLVDITGDGFLQNMVRILTGTLVEVGLGEREPAQIRDALMKKDRDLAGRILPAKGLCLMSVEYGEEKTKDQEKRKWKSG